ncbi:MAG TPA: TIGR00282 family metallophosphoesterase [Candidatus Saccharicenans sp.]|jgi:metallophosphoesterase (TIGR00282 family)|nr:TIGR00282 family metallophosphoesterase [Candidatus Saccharicenans sp.]HRD02867.1 TIGR00282 family metallophosphoesterase [Candidatus Saccharicenans sp.]
MPDKFRVLFIGDIVGRPGRRALSRFLPDLRKKSQPSLVMANGENAAGGIGLTEDIGRELLLQVDVLTSGNHIWDKKEVFNYLEKEPRLVRPANYPEGNPGHGYHIFENEDGIKAAILNLQGRVFMEPVDCPFRRAEKELETILAQTPIVIIDFHAEATSEKQALGWFLDGRVSAILGTHTHIQTADERILPGGTAYISDVGMAGGLNSVIGMKPEQAMNRFLTGRPQKFEPANEGLILGAVLLEIDAKSGKALSIKREMMIEDSLED